MKGGKEQKRGRYNRGGGGRGSDGVSGLVLVFKRVWELGYLKLVWKPGLEMV